MGGIPIATALSFDTNIPAIYVRKEAKKYGTCKLAEGIEFDGKTVTIIEDVVTTGGQIIKSAQQLRELGATVKDVMCVIVRDQKAFENLGKAELNLIPLFSMKELKDIIK
jgi:orotate phosphoribosyltransferase